jgi:MFS family permease
MLICALAVTPIVFVSSARNLWVAVGLVGLAAAAHQGWSANLFTTTSDMFPRGAVGSVVGIGGMAGAFNGATIAVIVGYILQVTGGNYKIPFFIAGSSYLVALLIIHLLVPKLEPVDDISGREIKPLSFGSIVGFGFMGSIFGAFSGWCIGLISRVSGSALLEFMAIGALLGVLVGIMGGALLITRSTQRVT